MDFGEDLSCLPLDGKLGETSGSVVCRVLQRLCKKAVLQYGSTLGRFWGENKSTASGILNKSCSCKESSNSSSRSNSSNSTRYRCESGRKSDTPKFFRREQSRKTFNRAISWSRYLDTEGEKDGQAATVFGDGVSEKYITDLSELFVGQKFASGSYSRLYHGFYKQEAVAVKLIMPPSDDEALAARLDKQFLHEVELLSRLHHRNIVEFVCACKSPPVFCVITEYLPGGSLKTYLHKREPYSLPIELVVRIAIDIANGMDFLHCRGVIHRDLKSDNLLMTEDLHIKVADFGVSCLETCKDNLKGNTGTYRWMAPEMIMDKRCSRKVDVYSFSIVLWELVTCRTPYENMTPVQAAFAVSQQNARPVIPPDCPKEIAKLMEKCWSTSPSKRPEFAQIAKVLHDFQTLTQ